MSVLFRRITRPLASTLAGIPEPRALLAPVDERIAQLELAFRFVHVSIDTHFVPEDCDCGQGTTSVRVYGDETAVPDVDDALVEKEVCQRCALHPYGPIWKAGHQSRSDRDIRVEVCA
ncbi:hypothetical protein [Amycolatopsis sp. NPDC051128]|uniref:hypothetical protein n=1 Tax=Amycolatopsis sp. NPDC051128 TaxID=3155412 RepID=UPI0034209B2D